MTRRPSQNGTEWHFALGRSYILRPVKTPRPLRERKKEATRRALLEIGNRLFHRKGFEATTIDEICEAAGVSRRTFFRYFANKEALVFPHRNERLDRFLRVPPERAAGREARRDPAPHRERLRARVHGEPRPARRPAEADPDLPCPPGPRARDRQGLGSRHVPRVPGTGRPRPRLGAAAPASWRARPSASSARPCATGSPPTARTTSPASAKKPSTASTAASRSSDSAEARSARALCFAGAFGAVFRPTREARFSACAHIASTDFGAAEVRMRWPSAVTRTSSSILTPIPRNEAGTFFSSGRM